jgi:DNA processing protein
MSEAPNILLKNGAKLVTTVEDILEEMHMKIIPAKQQEIDNKVDGEERKIILLLQREPQLSDELVEQTKSPVNLVLRTLSQLELKGMIEKNNEGKYQLR